MANLMNLGDLATTPCECVTHVDANGKYVVEKTGAGTLGIWGPFPDVDSCGPVAPHGRLRVVGEKWGCRMLVPGYYYISCDGAGSFTIRHWKFSDYVIGKLHGM